MPSRSTIPGARHARHGSVQVWHCSDSRAQPVALQDTWTTHTWTHNMKKLLLSTVALAGLTAGAMAADLPRRAVAPAPFVAVPVFTWTGFYIGANVGAGWNSRDRNDGGFFDFDRNLLVPTALGPAPVVPVNGGFGFNNGFGIGGRNNDVAILGGVQAGFNWQMAPGNGFVFG